MLQRTSKLAVLTYKTTSELIYKMKIWQLSKLLTQLTNKTSQVYTSIRAKTKLMKYIDSKTSYNLT